MSASAVKHECKHDSVTPPPFTDKTPCGQHNLFKFNAAKSLVEELIGYKKEWRLARKELQVHQHLPGTCERVVHHW